MRTTHGIARELYKLLEELESWAGIYISTRDEPSAQLARYYMIEAHAAYRAAYRRRILLRTARIRVTWIPPNVVASAKAVPIETVLERFLGLKLDRHGRGRCPFHGGKNPQSLHKLPNGNLVFCHVCQRSWDPIGALMTLEGIDFRSAVQILTKPEQKPKRLDKQRR